MAVLSLLNIEAFAKHIPLAKNKESLPNDEDLYRLKKKALKELQKYEQDDQEEDNEDLAYLNFRLIWPIGFTSLLSIFFFLLAFTTMETVQHLGFELYAVNQYAITYGKSILLCNNTVPYQKGMLPSFLRQLEIKVTTNIFFRTSVCVPMTIRIFVACCINKTTHEQPLTQKNSFVAYLNDVAAVIVVLEVVSLGLLSMITIRFDYPKIFKLMFGAFIVSSSLYMSLRTMLSIIVEKSKPIEHLATVVRLVSNILFIWTIPQVFKTHQKFIEAPVCHGYVISEEAVLEYIALFSYLAFNLVQLVDIRDIRFICFPRNSSGECRPLRPHNFTVDEKLKKKLKMFESFNFTDNELLGKCGEKQESIYLHF